MDKDFLYKEMAGKSIRNNGYFQFGIKLMFDTIKIFFLTLSFRTFIVFTVRTFVVTEADVLSVAGVVDSDVLTLVDPDADVLNDADKFGLGSYKLPGPFFCYG